MLVVVAAFVVADQADVHGREQREDERLDEADQHLEKASKGHSATTAARLADEMFAMAKGEKPSGRATG